MARYDLIEADWRPIEALLPNKSPLWRAWTTGQFSMAFSMFCAMERVFAALRSLTVRSITVRSIPVDTDGS